MVVSCSAFGCTNRHIKGGSIQFHKFPLNNPELLKKWSIEVKRKNFIPTMYSTLCSEHFKFDDNQIRPGATVKLLKTDAFPSIFKAFPSHLKKTIPVKRLKLDRIMTNDVDVKVEQQSTSSEQSTKLLVENETVSDVSVPSSSKLLNCGNKSTQCKLRSPTKQMLLAAELEERFGGYPLHLLLHEHKCSKPLRYSDLMKDFSKTLFFYSPKAYDYVRKLFTLPHPSTIRRWMSSTRCEPGFLSELIWEPSAGKYIGNVVFDDGSENTDLASEVLVFLVVSLTKRFKCPIAYFFVNKINSSALSSLVTSAIIKLHEIGIRIWSVICDGAPSNVQCFKKLGCNFNIDNLNEFKCIFTVAGNLEVSAVFDVCHMLKLARNCLADKGAFKVNNSLIQWQYIMALNNLQNNIGLKFANKLTSQHLNFRNSIMKVKLAAQSLSSGVADAIEYLQKNSNVEFLNSESTVYFIRQIDRLFDILNSRIPFAKGFKSPINTSNSKSIESVFNRFIVSMKSVLEMSYKLLYKTQSPFKFVLTYKVSQDHLELFFACVRSRGGCNNNPNCSQFKNTLRQLLLTRNITVKSGNCCDFDESSDEVIEFRSEKWNMKSVQNKPCEEDENKIQVYLQQLISTHLGEYVIDILSYISGYIVRSMMKKLVCSFCVDMLMENHQSDHNNYIAVTFVNAVNRGKLINASRAILLIVQHLEKTFQVIVVQKSQLHKNVEHNIVECARKSIQLKSSLFFFPGSHPINVDLGAPSHEYIQDAIKLFFGHMRGRFGSNNNPNCLQFTTAIKSILLHTFMDQEDEEESTIKLLMDNTSNDPFINTITDNVLYYISGYIVKKLIPVL
ncbi:hypothetical protein AGLY_018042 [Aphis glycines]|uniref:THAP-type domain-containing protein n=1 Tax=Aphis glycines TaxID=307491 RepID=A0A6G0STU8_APHGL|nr:hypothetical protein AGLY_018042 [Aphis glycines]